MEHATSAPEETIGQWLEQNKCIKYKYKVKNNHPSTEMTFENETQEESCILQNLKTQNSINPTKSVVSLNPIIRSNQININKDGSEEVKEDKENTKMPHNKDVSVEEHQFIENKVLKLPSRLEPIDDSRHQIEETDGNFIEGYPTLQIPDLLEITEKDERSVYVGNVDYSCSAVELAQLFKDKVEKIFRVTIATNRFSGAAMGFAYIEFGSVDDVMSAMELNNHVFKNRALNIQPKRTNLPGLTISKRSLNPGKRERNLMRDMGGNLESRYMNILQKRKKMTGEIYEPKTLKSRIHATGYKVGSFSKKNTKSFRYK